MARSLARPILTATLIAGTLDILAATAMSLLNGRDPMAMLRSVASGPFPGASGWGTGGLPARPRRPFRADGDHGGNLHPRRRPPPRLVAESLALGHSSTASAPMWS